MLIVLGGALWLWRMTQDQVRSRGVTRVDLTRSVLRPEGPWVPKQWSRTLRRLVAQEGAVLVDEPRALDSLRAAIEGLPFVAEVGPLRVIWPDGLDLSLRLHEPIACVRLGSKYYPVAMIPDEQTVRGVLLPGAADGPHLVDTKQGDFFLPVLAGFDGERARGIAVGEEILDGSVLAALDIADSLATHMNPGQQSLLGRVLIDATEEQAFDGLPGGARLDLEGVGEQAYGRRIHFGHAPCEAGPGELPLDLKWAHVLAALERGFDTVDVRFDVAEYHDREEP